MVARRDPEAAAILLAQLDAERQAARSPEALVTRPMVPVQVYDPADLYTRLAREFHWTDRYMDSMDYVRFFAMVDRLSKQREQERREEQRPTGGNGLPPEIIDAEQQAVIERLAPKPREYVGETVRYGG